MAVAPAMVTVTGALAMTSVDWQLVVSKSASPAIHKLSHFLQHCCMASTALLCLITGPLFMAYFLIADLIAFQKG